MGMQQKDRRQVLNDEVSLPRVMKYRSTRRTGRGTRMAEKRNA